MLVRAHFTVIGASTAVAASLFLFGCGDDPGSGTAGAADAGSTAWDAWVGAGDDANATSNDGGAATDARGDTGAGGDADAASALTEVAPYFYTWGWGSNAYAFPSLAAMKQMGGPSAVTIAFVLSDNGACRATTDIQNNLTDVRAYIAAGGHVKASFGGADGTYIESACHDATSLATALSDFVTATGITDLDFDIEQGASTSNATINAMRASALKRVQTDKGIRVAFTLPVNPDGLDDLGKAIVTSAVSAGVTISFVNVMTMDYGSGQGSNLGMTAVGSADATAKQLVTLIPGLTLAAAYRKVGATPMIGHNDDGNVFSVNDAKTLAAFAKQKSLGLLAFWAIQRDERCPGALDLNLCSGVNAATFDFSAVFEAVAH
jgi:chitinase